MGPTPFVYGPHRRRKMAQRIQVLDWLGLPRKKGKSLGLFVVMGGLTLLALFFMLNGRDLVSPLMTVYDLPICNHQHVV